MAEVRFEHVNKRYGLTVDVIKDLNLDIHDQEFLVLVGPSGCGKSTALRMIAGLEEITSGELYIGERVVNDVAPKDRDIAMVFQNYALYPHMSVYDNMAFGLKLRHTPTEEIKRRVDDAADILGLTQLLQRKPKELSGGQRQRVALGRAIVREPQVFLMDEPLSNLDAKLRVQMRAEIARLHQRIKTTTVYVTHDQIEAMTMGDRIAVMSAGVIQQLGTPQELYDHPSNLFVAGFIGSPAMNFFTARLAKEGDALVATVGQGAETQRVTLTGAASAAVASKVSASGRTIVLGIRPEDFEAGDGGPGQTMTGTVEVVEHLGNEQLVHLRMPGVLVPEGAELRAVTARVAPGVQIHAGDKLPLTVATSKVHVFDPDSTDALV
ncbi:MAG TPA: sn-glycerol-3-phosphate ABC transporter ATP-binding protein UgpC [Ktedonobacterales bacterium]|jgi:multiple sugar transport system ATP-binding protein